jgi:hypothetical protein
MFKRVPLQFISLVILFTFCQVIGTMCALPDLAEAEETAILVEENMACPMDGTIMCPPSAISSPERQLRQAAAVHLDLAPLLQAQSRSSMLLPIPHHGHGAASYLLCRFL